MRKVCTALLLLFSMMLLCLPAAYAQDEDEDGGGYFDGGDTAGGGGSDSDSGDSGTAGIYTTGENDDMVNLDFSDVDIKVVARKIAEITGKNMIIENSLSGKITVLSPNAVTKEEAFQAFITALNSKGYTVVQSGKFLKIIQSRKANETPITTVEGNGAENPNSDLYITKIIPIKNVPAKDIERTLKPFVAHRNIRTYEPTNVLVITDTASNISRLQKMIKEFDRPGFSEKVEFVVLKNAGAKEVAQKLSEMYGIGGGEGKVKKVAYGGGNKGTSSDAIVSSIIPDERTNSLMVRGNQKGIEAMRLAAMHLDSDLTDYRATPQIYVYQLEHADARKVAEILTGILGGSRGGGDSYSRSSYSRSFSRINDEGGGGGGGGLSNIGAEVKISADEKTNALVIVATKASYDSLKPTIVSLDKKRKQVEIAATIMEITLGNGSNFGVSGYGGGASGKTGFLGGSMQGGGNKLGSAVDPKTAMGGLSGLVAGVGTTTQVSLGNGFSIPAFMAVVNASGSENKGNVLANPRIVTMDNEPAMIEVGDEVYIQSGFQKSAEGNAIIANFSKEKATLLINMTPKINKSNEVSLKIEQDVREIVPIDTNGDTNSPNRGISTRKTKTVVLAKSGETVAIGGLIRDKTSKVLTKVPVLGDIPVIGWLFKSQTATVSKTNLILFVTPQVMDNAEDRARVTNAGVSRRHQHMARNKIKADDWVGTNEAAVHPAGVVVNYNNSGSNGHSNVVFEDDEN